MSNPKHERNRSKDDPTFGFLDENANERPRANDRSSGKDSRYPVIRKPVPVSESGALRPPNADARGADRSSDTDGEEAGDDFGFLDDIDLSPTGSSSGSSPGAGFDDDDWERPAGYDDDEPPRLWRRIALAISICALVAGSVLFSLPWLKQQGIAFDMPEDLPFGLNLELPFDIPGFGKEAPEAPDTEIVTTTPAESVETAAPETTVVPEPDADAAPSRPQASSLGSRFRDSLNEIESLVANEQYDQAGQAIAALDRSVYGYGATEFQALEARITEVQGASDASAAAALQEEADAREAAEAEQARIEAEAARADEARVQAEREREQAAEASETAEAREAARVAAQARLDSQAAEQRRRTIAEQAASDRQATDRAVAEERAANERRAVAQQEQEQLQQEQTVARAPEQTSSAPVSGPITDADLQLVYGRFSDLAIAIETGNINDVISLTTRSTSRIQQFLQVFENSDFVSARITNVATRNASGSVTGTLSISGITRADGSTVDPPANIRSIKLISTREGSGWSLIDW